MTTADAIPDDAPLAVASFAAIHAGDVTALRQLLADNPGLATAGIVSDGQHGADGRIEPLRRQDLARRGADRRIAVEPADRIAKAAAGFIAGIELGIHHGASLLQGADRHAASAYSPGKPDIRPNP